MKKYERQAEEHVCNQYELEPNHIKDHWGALYAWRAYIAGYLAAREEAANICKEKADVAEHQYGWWFEDAYRSLESDIRAMGEENIPDRE